MAEKRYIKQMEVYYEEISDVRKNDEFISVRDKIKAEIEEYKLREKNASIYELKAKLYESIAENFKPKIFLGCPFFFEMGIKNSKSLGGGLEGYPSMLLADLSVRRARNFDFIRQLGYDDNGEGIEKYLGVAYGPVFDEDHHCPGYTKIFEKGVQGLIEEIDKYTDTSDKADEVYSFRMAARRGLMAFIRVAERFSLEAERLLETVTDEADRRYLVMIRDAAKVVPKEPPKTFYQGLCTLLFTYEVVDAFEGLGMSVLGHIDRLLGPLYDADIRSGVITREEAAELLCCWLSVQDIKCGARDDPWADISCTLALGGCDESGRTVYNDITKMVLEIHEKNNLINPKLNFRISKNTPEECLELISASILCGHNVIALLNDDVIIPALINTGKEIFDARLYVNGGCQETMCEGCEHTAGVMFYFNLPRVLELSLNTVNTDLFPEEITAALPKVIQTASSFEDFYRQYFENMKRMLRYTTETRRVYGEKWRESHPSLIFSSTLKGCVESGKDFTAGGAKYNRSTASCIGFATLCDSLYAIKRAVFDEKVVSLEELRIALARNFSGYEELRARLISYPKFGHNEPEADMFAGRVFSDLNDYVETLDNERGEKYIFSTFTFGNHVYAAPYVGATADGKLSGELLSQSVGPSRVRPVSSLTDAIGSQSALPLDRSGGISVLDVILPSSTGLTKEKLAATLRAFCMSGGQALQPNFVTREQMIEAKKEPDKHRDLIVRVCGLSVYFVNLPEHFKDDMINRNYYAY